MEFKTEEDSETENSDTNSEFNLSSNQSKLKRNRTSYVWTFFREKKKLSNGKEVNECIICNAYVGNQTSNLARHLITTHSITKPNQKGLPEEKIRLRPSRSFVWKYSTKEDLNHARCHFCNKVLYCGGGNTSNLSKHLRRRHMELIDEHTDSITGDRCEEVAQATSTIMEGEFIEEGVDDGDGGIEGSEEKGFYRVYAVENCDNEGKNTNADASGGGGGAGAKDRKGSYVWNFCDKLSRYTIRCKLCSKVMSFHGTANVITHLQRRHNVVGPLCKEPTPFIVEKEEAQDVVQDNNEPCLVPRRRSLGTASVVWKYCKRISRDTVRCSFCNKNLSYQGTSNLQRHLHRMHGIVMQGRNYRPPTANQNTEQELTEMHFDAEFLWEYLEEIENGSKAKCKMCDAVLDAKNMTAISKHLVASHSLRPPGTNETRPKRLKSNARFNYSDDSGDDNGNWSNFGESDTIEEITELNIKKDDSFFNEIIEEDHEATNYDEEQTDANVSQTISNPLSPQSTQSCAGDMSPDCGNNKHSSCMYRSNPKLQKLNEERLRMETEYFKEKAAFFRMQKYLTGLQAKKMRLEMDRLNNSAIEYTGPTYTVNVDIPQEELAILPTQ